MTCLEAQSLITPFINDQLDMATLESFLTHINECPNCKEELEVYYALLTAMKLLDEDKELSHDFSQELNNKLKSSSDRIRRMKNRRIRKRFYFLMLLLGIILFSSIKVGTSVITPLVPKKPSFLLHYTVKPDYMDFVQNFIDEYDEEARAYVAMKKQQRIIVWQQLKKDEVRRYLYIREQVKIPDSYHIKDEKQD